MCQNIFDIRQSKFLYLTCTHNCILETQYKKYEEEVLYTALHKCISKAEIPVSAKVKVKLSLVLIKHHTNKTNVVVEVFLHSFFTLTLDGRELSCWPCHSSGG
jgi:hypothetical protein